MGWQIAVDPVDWGLQTLQQTGSLRWRTFDIVFKRWQVLQGSTVSANRQCWAASGKPGNPFGQGGPMWDKCLQHVIGLPVCSGHNSISVGGDSSELGFYSLMSLGLILVILTGKFEFLEGEHFADNCLTSRDWFGGGSVMVWSGIMSRRKTNLIVVQGNLNAQGTLTRFCSLKRVLSFKGMGLPYWCMIMQGLMLQGHVDSF